ncbi:MAG: site-specific DNA-methyltransferase [Clostridium sp.]|nr:site-specific DNA-methyltransferase [Clostridium sp.]
MDKLKMHTPNKADENFKKLAALFPNAVTETIDENGEVVRAIDKDVLMQEISCTVVDGKEERYQFTWPDKKKSVLLANAPISKTLRPLHSESVNFDKTENLYIEGDNLEVLKLLQETYLGKIKVIYIDPPYNTGKDFLYKDNYAVNTTEYLGNSNQYDEDGNQMYQHTESDGRFHSKWLCDMYPRIRLAKDLLTEDGVIFISIDEKEYHNLRKICDEVFGEKNYIGDLVWEATTQPINAGSAKFGLQKKTEPILLYAKNKNNIIGFELEELEGQLSYPHQGKFGPCRFEIIEKSDAGGYSRPSMKFAILGQYPREGKRWQIGEDTARLFEKQGKVEIVDGIVKKAVYPEDELDKKQYKPFWSLLTADAVGTAQTGKDELNKLMGTPVGFDTVKPTQLIKKLLSYLGKDYCVLDFFSGSGTTAHAAMALNKEDGGTRKFIMVQIPEKCSEDSDAFKAGYNTICDLAKARLKKAINQIYGNNSDVGFRVLKCDTSNMKDVFYSPADFDMNLLDLMADNIKEDRTPEDLLFQVMLDLGVTLSSKIEETTIAGKKVFDVADGFLVACFDKDVSDETIKAIAQKQPYYFVMRDSSLANDSVATNFEQIFATYSPDTVRKVL